jgi:hypothetical protein
MARSPLRRSCRHLACAIHAACDECVIAVATFSAQLTGMRVSEIA